MSEKMNISKETSPEKIKFQKVIKQRIEIFNKALDDLESTEDSHKELNIDINPSFLDDLEKVGFFDYNTADFMKILFDEVSSTLEYEFKKNKENPQSHPTKWILTGFGDYGIHAYEIYKKKSSKKIPESEHDIHTYGNALKNLSDIHSLQLDDVLEFYETSGDTEMASKIKEIINKSDGLHQDPHNFNHLYYQLNKDTFDIYKKLRIETLKKLLKEFPKPFLNIEDKKKILKDLVDKLEAVL